MSEDTTGSIVYALEGNKIQNSLSFQYLPNWDLTQPRPFSTHRDHSVFEKLMVWCPAFSWNRQLWSCKETRMQSSSTSSLAEGRESISKAAGCLARLCDLAPPMWALASFVSEDFQGCHIMAQQEAKCGEQHVFCFLVPFRSHICFNKEVLFTVQTTTPTFGARNPTGVLCLANCCSVFCSQSDGLE